MRIDHKSLCCLFPSVATLVILCITLLTNEAAQNMARWTFDGDHRLGAVVGLVLCVSVPLALFVRVHHVRRKLARLIDEASPAIVEADSTPRV